MGIIIINKKKNKINMQIISKKEFNLIELKSDSGKYLTFYNDSDDIIEYYSTTIIYCPSSYDISLIREIDESTNNEYIKKRDTEIAKKLEENKEEE